MATVPSLDAASIAESSLRAQQQRLAVSAHNIANLNTEGFEAKRANLQERPAGGVRSTVTEARVPNPVRESPQGREVVSSNTDLVQETVNQISARNAFEASAAVLATADETKGTLVDILS